MNKVTIMPASAGEVVPYNSHNSRAQNVLNVSWESARVRVSIMRV